VRSYRITVIIFNYKQVCHPIRAQSTRLDTKCATRPIWFDAMRYTERFEIANCSPSNFQTNVQINVHNAVSQVIVDKSAFICTRTYLTKIGRGSTIIGNFETPRTSVAREHSTKCQRHGVCTSWGKQRMVREPKVRQL